MANVYTLKRRNGYLAYLEIVVDTDYSSVIVQQYTFIRFYTTTPIVSWSSSDPSKLEVFQDGTGFAHANNGTVVVTGTASDGSTVEVTITLAPFTVQRIDVNYV